MAENLRQTVGDDVFTAVKSSIICYLSVLLWLYFIAFLAMKS
jgi:hypothetical protein